MYQVLDRNLLPIGRLTLNPGNNATTFWADSIQKQIAQDNSQSDPASTMSMILNQGSSDANEKLFNHSLSVTFDNSDSVGAKVEAQSTYLMYQDEGNNRYYLMSVIQVDQESNYRTAQAQNTAIIELGKIFTTGKTFTQVRLGDILKYVFSFAPFTVNYPDDNQVVLDSYVIDAKDSVLKVLQDLQVKYDVDMDAYVELDINGRINNRIVSFENIGDNKGLILRYGSRNKGFENLVKTTVSDTLYTKYHITGVTKDGNTNAGSIKSVNNGKDYIVDDNANQKYNPIGASQNPPTYLEVYLENTVLSEPLALLSWGKQIMGLFNHPRDNYTVTAMHDTDVSLGDTIVVQDNSKKPAVVISARVIQITSSFASPETNVIVLGEFTNLTSTKSNTGDTVLTQLKKDITTAQNAANEAVNTAELAKKKADEANQNAQTASQKIDETMATEKSRVDGLLDKQTTKIQGVVKDASDYTDSAKAEVLNKSQSMADKAQDGAVAQSKVAIDSITNWVKDSNGNISSSMMTALFNTTALKDFDKNSSVKSQTANMISSAVSSSENGMRSLISQKADSTVIGTISDDVNALKKSTQWEQINYDDLNFLKTQGNYLITSGAGTNSPIQPWFYITVDAPRGDRITQHIWKDIDASASYTRTFDGSNWSAWTQVVNSSTLLSIFNDQWSLGTYINTSIGQKIATGISGLPDGTLALTGRSIHLTGDTIVDGSFMTKALSTQDATIGRKLTLGSGGSIDSKVLTMDDNSFNVLADNINSVYTSYDNWQVTTKGMFSIYSNLGTVQSAGSTHIVNNANGDAVDGSYFTQYSTNQVYMTSTASDQDSDFLQQTQMTSTMLVLASGKGSSIQNRPNTTVVRSTGISTSGYMNAGNLKLNGIHSIVSSDGGDINFTRDDGNPISIRAYWVSAGNIRLNGNHSIISQDGGKLYITNAYGNASDLSVKSLSQTSLVSTKEHIGNIDPEYALAETLKADVRQYNFIGDPTDDIHVTPMIDDVEGKMYIPKDWLSYEGDSVDTYSIIGYLVQSVKALKQEIDALKG